MFSDAESQDIVGGNSVVNDMGDNSGGDDIEGGHDGGHDVNGEDDDVDEIRTVDKEEMKNMEDFFENGCRCKQKCSAEIGIDVVRRTRADCAELSRNELDMYTMGQLSCITFTSKKIWS